MQFWKVHHWYHFVVQSNSRLAPKQVTQYYWKGSCNKARLAKPCTALRFPTTLPSLWNPFNLQQNFCMACGLQVSCSLHEEGSHRVATELAVLVGSMTAALQLHLAQVTVVHSGIIQGYSIIVFVLIPPPPPEA